MPSHLSDEENAYLAEVARRLRAAMNRHPTLKTQSQLAQAAGRGVTQPTLSRFFGGQAEPSLLTLASCTRALGVPLASLFPEQPEQLAPPLPAAPLLSGMGPDAPLSDLQRAFLQMATKLLVQGKLGDRECIELMNAWVARLEPTAQAG